MERQAKLLPDIDQRFRKGVDQRVVMIGRWRDAQPLGAAVNGRIVDRLDIDAVLFEQQIARRLALLRVADEQRNDMGLVGHHRKTGSRQHGFHAAGAVLVALALPARRLEVLDRGSRSGADSRRQRGGDLDGGAFGESNHQRPE